LLRRESALLDEGIVQRQYHRLVVHDVKGMAEPSRIAHAGHLSQIVPVHLQELHEGARALIREAEDHAMLDTVFRRILGDAPEDGRRIRS
jgi:hypothetical protein